VWFRRFLPELDSVPFAVKLRRKRLGRADDRIYSLRRLGTVSVYGCPCVPGRRKFLTQGMPAECASCQRENGISSAFPLPISSPDKLEVARWRTGRVAQGAAG